MRSLIKRLWNDPVWSKVIAGVILTLLGAAWVYYKRHPVAWDRVTTAFGRAWDWMLAPVGVARVLIGLAVLVLVICALRALRRLRIRRVLPAAPPPKELTADDLNAEQRRLLSVLIRLYPKSSSVRAISEAFLLQYPAAERLCEGLEKLGLITVTPVYDAKSLSLTTRGRDFCYEQGIAVDR